MKFAPAVFLSALLLFLLQSVAGKQLLPWFGGAPATWAACLMFFQLLLLAGYAYAWALDRWCSPNCQRLVHAGLMVSAGVQLMLWTYWWGAPLLAPEAWKPRGDEAPIGLILKALSAGTGLPFLVLAGNSPLLQRWAAESGVAPARVFRLYAVSNFGSLLGLLSFPFLFEPRWPLPVLAAMWGGGFVLLMAAAAYALLADARHSAAAPPEQRERGMTAPWQTKVLWVLLSAAASAMLLATTNQLCQEVALVPLLWVLPLALYLGAFMIAFHDERWYCRKWVAAPAALASLVALGFAIPGIGLPVPWVILSLSVFLFLICWISLGELFRLKPAAAGLTGYYLAIAAGGALGGAAIGLGAPLLLTSGTEFQWSMLIGWSIIAVVLWRDRTSLLHRGDTSFYLAAVFFASAGLLRLTNFLLPESAPAWQRGWTPALTGGAVLTLLLYTLTRRSQAWQQWRFWPRLMTGIVIFSAYVFTMDATRGAGAGVLAAGRNFFGTVRVQRVERRGTVYTRLVHGQVNHGFQYDDAALRRQPAGYCDAASGIGLAIAGHARRRPVDGTAPQPLRIGVAGLGVGAMAAHLREGDLMRFYEINPLVIAWAAGPHPWFSYIQDSAGKTETVTGDARLAMEREWLAGGSQQYDLLVLDAFSSDAVPVHLLTVEAFELYLKHLRDADSLLAINISNRFVDFRPLLRTLAAHYHLEAQLFYHPGSPPVPTPNLWMLLGRKSPAFFQLARPWQAGEPDRRVLWTDSHSDIFRLLRWSATPLDGKPGAPP